MTTSDIDILPPIPDAQLERKGIGQIPDAMKRLPTATATSNTVSYTRASMTEVVQAVAHTLAYFSDKDHPGLHEPQNLKREVPGTGVLVKPRVSGHENLVGFQFYFTDNTVAGHHVDKITAVVFDFEIYEKIGDRYIFNLLKKLSELVKTAKRPSDAQLKELSTRFVLST